MTEIYKPTVLVDMDGVLADFDAGVIRLIESRYPSIDHPRERLNFLIAEDYPEHLEHITEFANEPGFFGTLPLVEGALEGWQRIIDFGYQPKVCSSPIRTNSTCEQEKLEWLNHHFAPIFGEKIVKQAIVSGKKYLQVGIAIIDDQPEIKKSAQASWQHIIFDRPYNQKVGGLRLYGWSDQNLGEILKRAERLYKGIGSASISNL